MTITAVRGRLRREIEQGKLHLDARGQERFCFSFCVKDDSIGTCTVQSIAPNEIRLMRVWNIVRGFASRPGGLVIPAEAPRKRYDVVQAGMEVVLAERHTLGGHEPVDEVVLAVEAVRHADGGTTNEGRHTWEVLDLKVKCRAD